MPVENNKLYKPNIFLGLIILISVAVKIYEWINTDCLHIGGGGDFCGSNASIALIGLLIFGFGAIGLLAYELKKYISKKKKD